MLRTLGASGLVMGILLSALGCMTLPRGAGSSEWLEELGMFGGQSTPVNKIFLQTTLIDQPAGDPYLTRDLWQSLTRPLAPEHGALLAENGVRVGLIDGNPPPEFLRLVTSEQHTLRPMQSTCTPGDAKVIPVNGPLDQVSFGVLAEIGTTPMTFDLPGAECGFAITPKPAADGQVQLHIEPRVQHGQKQGWLRPTADGTGFAWRDGKPAESFGKLAWDVTVTPSDYLVIGSTERPVGTLGSAFFLNDANGLSRMRVLVIRAWRGPDRAEPTTSSMRAVAVQAGAARP